jgi:Zn ribbon nucleic-acid-binding protein
MSYPKIAACAECRTGDNVDVYKYKYGWKHVECERCGIQGPGERRILDAIRSWNAGQKEAAGAAP